MTTAAEHAKVWHKVAEEMLEACDSPLATNNPATASQLLVLSRFALSVSKQYSAVEQSYHQNWKFPR